MKSKTRLVIVGAGGHARSVLALLDRLDEYEVVALVDTYQPPDSYLFGLPIISSLDQLACFCADANALNLCVAIGDNIRRQVMSERLIRMLPDSNFPTLVDPTAVVASGACLAQGVVVMAHAHVGAGCHVESGCLVNTQASIDHDCILGTFSSLAPGVITGGRVEVGSRSFIGLGSRIIHGIKIGADTVVGAGSLVIKDQPSRVLSYGAPAVVIRTRRLSESYL